MENRLVVYVEDDAPSRDVVHILCHVALPEVQLVLFESSESFLERLAALPKVPDMILLDIRVKPIGGIELFRLLQASEQFRLVPVVVVTASVTPQEVHHLQAEGVKNLIGKPIPRDLFPTLIRSVWAGETVWVPIWE